MIGDPHSGQKFRSTGSVTFREQAIEVGERRVAANEEPEAFAVRLARPPAVPCLTARTVRADRQGGNARIPAPANRSADSVPRRTRPCASRRHGHHSRDRVSLLSSLCPPPSSGLWQCHLAKEGGTYQCRRSRQFKRFWRQRMGRKSRRLLTSEISTSSITRNAGPAILLNCDRVQINVDIFAGFRNGRDFQLAGSDIYP